MNQTNIQKAFDDLNAKYLQALKDLDHALDIIQQHAPTHSGPDADLKTAARLMSQSAMNKEDLSADEIYDKLIKLSEDEVKKQVGFWAMPLPKSDDTTSNKKYIGKRR